MGNKYVKRSKISEAKFRELARLFALDLTATQMAELSGLNRNTVNRYVRGIRERIAEFCNFAAPVSVVQYGRENFDKNKDASVFGISEKNGSIYTILIDGENLSLYDLNNSEMDVIIDMDNGTKRWLKERKVLQETNASKITRIDGFQGFLKSRLEKFKGIHSHTFYLHLKESEFRYNNPKSELYHLILKIIRNNPLF